MEAIIGIIWIVIVFNIIRAATKKSTKTGPSRPPSDAQLRMREDVIAAAAQTDNQQAPPANPGGTFRSVPGTTSGTTRTVNYSGAGTTKSRAAGYGYGAFAPANTSGKIKSSRKKDSSDSLGAIHAGSLLESAVLLEDRRNDWLAKQLREEASIKRRGSVYDLGAIHDADCEADKIKRQHAMRHNSNGLNRNMFR